MAGEMIFSSRREELRRHSDAVSLQCERQRGEGAEEVGAHETERRPPEGEDHQRDRDPARTLGETVDPLRRDRQAEGGAADPGQGTAGERVRVAVGGDIDPHRVRGRRRFAHRADVQADARPGEVERDRNDEYPRRVDEDRLPEDHGPDHAEVLQRLGEDLLELVPRRRSREIEVVAEVRRETHRPGEDRQRETRDDLIRTQGHDEERVDQRHRASRQRGDGECGDEHERRGPVHPLHDQESHHRPDEHHPLDPEVQHARPLGEELSERGIQKRRPVRDARRDHDHEQAVVHRVGSSAGAAALRARRSKRTR